MISTLLCRLGLHRWVEESSLTCKSYDRAIVCQRCGKVKR